MKIKETRQESRHHLAVSRPFHELPIDVVSEIFDRMEERLYDSGEVLIRQEDPGDHLLVLLEGEVDVSVRDPSGGAHHIARAGRGDVIGEMALITGEKRSADVTAVGEVRALGLSALDFHDLARQHLELGMLLTNLIADRLGGGQRDGVGGKLLHGYRVGRCVGRGGMAVVYAAEEVATGRRVALKMMSHRLIYEPGALHRFRQEAAIVEHLEHDNVARLFGRFSAFGTHFLVMEYCDGPGLNRVIKRHGAIPVDHVKPIIGQLAAALAYVHRKGVIHRDIKPSNVMLTRDSKVKLMDFGLAKPVINLAGDTLTLPTHLVGTPVYMAPEQFSGAVDDPRSDTYGVACIAYEMLTGNRPFPAHDLTQLIQQKLSPPTPDGAELGKGVGEELIDLVRGGLQPRPADRPPSLEPYTGWAGPVDEGLVRSFLDER
ncbi:MAG: protein kinase [bacterium]|nr:protein kinase [bacterium]